MMVQKLLLKDFEFNINPNIWNRAQDLVQAGAVKNLREVERNFWVAQVQEEEQAFEAEVMISPLKIKAFACECFAEGRKMMCPHVAATLLKVRQFLEQKNAARQAKAEARANAPAPNERFTVQTVLAEASPEALLEFVRDYARRDRDFGLALKTWFAGAFSGSTASNSWSLVLDSVLPKSTSAPLLEPDFRRLKKTLDGLESQLESAAQQANFPVVFQIAGAVLEKILPLLEKNVDRKRDQLLHFCQISLQKLLKISEEEASPELREEIWQTVFALAEQQRWPTEMAREVVRFLADAAMDEAKFASLRGLFDRTLAPVPSLVLHLFLAALARRNRPEAVARVLEDYAAQPPVVRDAVVQLYYLNHWDAARVAGNAFLEKGIFNAGQRRELEDVLFFIAEKTEDLPAQMEHLRRRFVHTGLFDFYEKLKDIATAGGDWPAERERVLADLQLRGDRRNIAAILASEGETRVLAALLESHPDLPLLQQYEHLFLPQDHAFVRARYVDILANYLREHFGRQASGYAREALAGLLAKGEDALAGAIIRALVEAFPDRQTLPEELTEMFPKTKRKAILEGNEQR